MIGMLLKLRRKLLGTLVVYFSFLLLYFLMTPQCVVLLSRPLEDKLGALPEKIDAQAIVILGGGQRRHAPELGGRDTVSSHSLLRLTYGAVLYRRTALPILVSGGRVGEDTVSEASVMAESLREAFAISPKWLEERSQNTKDNALYSAEILKAAGIKKLVLVTEAIHMKRALLAFSKTGLEVLAAPTNYLSSRNEDSVLSWIPDSLSLKQSTQAIHEWVGYVWYRISIP